MQGDEEEKQFEGGWLAGGQGFFLPFFYPNFFFSTQLFFDEDEDEKQFEGGCCWLVAKCHARLVLSLCCTLAASHNDNDDDQVGHVGDHAHDYDVIKPVQDIRIVSLLHIGCRSQ